MPVQLESVESNVSCVAGSSLVVNKPAGTVDGDLLLFYGYGRPSAGVDWNIGFGATVNTLHIRNDGSIHVVAMHVGWRIASGEPSSYTFTWPASTGVNGRGGAVHRITGFKTAAPIDLSNEGLVAVTVAGSGLATWLDLTTTVADTLLLRFISGEASGWNTDGAELSNFSASQAAVEQYDRACAAGGRGMGLYNSDFGGPGAIGTATVNVGVSGNGFASVAVVAIIPAPSGGGGNMGDPGTMLQPGRERVQRVQIPKGTKIRNPFRNIYEDDEGRM